MAFGKPDFKLTESTKLHIKELALEIPHEETGGFVLSNGDVKRCENTFYNPKLDEYEDEYLPQIADKLQIRDIPVGTDPEEMRRLISLRTGFSISGKDRVEYESTGIVAVWHSHCLDSSEGRLSWDDNQEFGVVSDITQAKLQRLPYILYHTGFDQWDMYDPYGLDLYPLHKTIANPKNIEEYSGIPYCWNRADCLEVPRVALWGLYEIDLGVYLRTSVGEYVAEGWQRYVQGFPNVGFQEVSLFPTMKFKGGDCLLMQLPGYKTLHHLAVVVDEPQQRLLHIFDGRVSEIEHIMKWRRFIRVVYRHEKFM